MALSPQLSKQTTFSVAAGSSPLRLGVESQLECRIKKGRAEGFQCGEDRDREDGGDQRVSHDSRARLMRREATKEYLQGLLLCVGTARYIRKNGIYRSALDTSLNLFEISLSIY
jgi:hypothetical protein